MGGEGLVVASESDGRLFKWKHAGEELGKVPERLAKAVRELRTWAGDSRRAKLLPTCLVAGFERALHFASTKPRVGGPTKSKEKKAKDSRIEKAVDREAVAAWESTLTKYNDLDAIFANGVEDKTSLEEEFLAQIAADLVKDYGADAEDARQRATRIVKAEMGAAWGAWNRTRKTK